MAWQLDLIIWNDNFLIRSIQEKDNRQREERERENESSKLNNS